MADYCVQCAADHNFLMTDFTKEPEGCVRPVICEGCGHTIIDHAGRCLADCLEHHGKEFVQNADGTGWKYVGESPSPKLVDE